MTAERRFAYHRSLAPMLWALIALSLCELCVVHLLVALLWSRWIALGLSVGTVAGMAWLAMVIRSFRRLPVLVDGTHVVMRTGRIRGLMLARTSIVRVRSEIGATEAKARDVLNLALLAHPNVVLDVNPPLRLGRRQIRAVAHRLDDPTGFVAALAGE